MSSLKETNTINGIANSLYEYLPGSGHQSWKGHVTFATVASRVGVGEFWQAGSKLPAIHTLIELTLDNRRHLLEPLIVSIVREGVKYRRKKGTPVKLEEIKKLNGLLLELNVRPAELWDHTFLESLDADDSDRRKKMVDAVLHNEALIKKKSEGVHRLEQIKHVFYKLLAQKDRQAAGLALESVLNDLFDLFQLAARGSFKVVGEQIDGSFKLDNEIYLIEAKWEADPLPVGPLLIFRGKVEGKSQFTRGMFISINGFSPDAKLAITTGKQPNFFLFDGYDLTMVLEGNISLDLLLNEKLRSLAEKGKVHISAKEVLDGQAIRAS